MEGRCDSGRGYSEGIKYRRWRRVTRGRGNNVRDSEKTSACKVAASDLFTAQCPADCNMRWAVAIDVTDELEGFNGIGGSLLGMDRSTLSVQRSFNFPRLLCSENGKPPVILSGQIPAISMHLWFHWAGSVLSSTRWWRSVSNDKLTRTWQNVFTLFDDECSKSFRCDCRRTWCHG